MTIWERIALALSEINLPKAEGVYIPSSASGLIPETFLVYFLVSSSSVQHADNREILRSYLVQISIYNRTGLTNLPDVTTPMKNAGFVRNAIREIPYNQETGHYGLALDFHYEEV